MTPRNKNISLLVGFLITLIICYQFAISNTIELHKRFNKLQQEDVLYQNSPKQFSILKKKEQYYDSIRTQYQLAGSSLQNNLLKTINNYTNELDLQLISFLEPHTKQKEGMTINTYEIKIKGGYNASIQLIYKLEQQTRFGEIIHLQMEKKKDFKNNSFYLETTFLLQSYQ